MVRIADFIGIIPAITGKVELVYEGELEGPANVAFRLLGQAIRAVFIQYFPDPQSFKTPTGKQRNAGAKQKPNPYQPIIDWFGQGHDLTTLQDATDDAYRNGLYAVDGLHAAVKAHYPKADAAQSALLMEFVLHGLAEFSLIAKRGVDGRGYAFGDILGSMLNMDFSGDEDDLEEDDL